MLGTIDASRPAWAATQGRAPLSGRRDYTRPAMTTWWAEAHPTVCYGLRCFFGRLTGLFGWLELVEERGGSRGGRLCVDRGLSCACSCTCRRGFEVAATERVVVLMSASEKAALERKAAAAGRISTGEFIRHAAAAYNAETARDEAELAALLPLLRATMRKRCAGWMKRSAGWMRRWRIWRRRGAHEPDRRCVGHGKIDDPDRRARAASFGQGRSARG